MASATGTSPLPPPLPPAPNDAPRNSSKLQIPLNCFPKVDTLRYLIQHINPNLDTSSNLNSDDTFDSVERRNLRVNNYEIADKLVQLMTNCEIYRLQAQSSQDKLRMHAMSSPDSSPSAQLQQEALMHQQKYNACLSTYACPNRMQVLFQCFRNTNVQVMQELQRHNAEHLMCRDERQAVERCVGDLVAKSVRAADGNDSQFGEEGIGDLWWSWDANSGDRE